MNYYEWVQDIIDYLELHLKEEINMEALIHKSFYSKAQFYRIFGAIIGVSTGGYVKKRRLSCAAVELCMTEKRILDIALDYGFYSQEVFTRAFQREYDIPPGKMRRNGNDIPLYEKVDVRKRIEDKKNLLNDYCAKLIVHTGCCLVGYEAVVTPGSDSIKTLWKRFMEERYRIQITEPDLVFGICEYAPEITEEDDFLYYFGLEESITQTEQVPEEKTFKNRKLPASKYVRILYEPKKRSLKDTYNMFYGVWLPISALELDQKDTVEIYHLKDDWMEICIPVK